jgi:hypothetical protein
MVNRSSSFLNEWIHINKLFFYFFFFRHRRDMTHCGCHIIVSLLVEKSTERGSLPESYPQG